MPLEIEIHNRITVGFALGWAYYSRDEENEWSEIHFFLGLIGITLKY